MGQCWFKIAFDYALARELEIQRTFSERTGIQELAFNFSGAFLTVNTGSEIGPSLILLWVKSNVTVLKLRIKSLPSRILENVTESSN